MDEAYSYRNDPAVPAFPDERPIVIFDGNCVLCYAFVEISHPLTGLIVRYRGWLVRPPPS